MFWLCIEEEEEQGRGTDRRALAADPDLTTGSLDGLEHNVTHSLFFFNFSALSSCTND